LGGFSAQIWKPTADVQAFAQILSEIVLGASAEQGCCSRWVRELVSEMMENGRSIDLKTFQ
jgi:hypothetical protein